ncbi:MAG: heme ABC exporter ATP-binding protein CcmA [Pseudorhodoplanes sp.]
MQLSAAGLGCIRGGREIFAGVDFLLTAGDALAVTGRNGAGKSSLLRIIAGLLRPASGQVTLQGGDPERAITQQAHYLGHQDALKPALSVSENLRFWSDYLGCAKTASDAALDRTGLAALARLPAAYLSAGQKRRLSMARLLAVRRPIWLLDEPLSALDAEGQSLFAALMRDHLGGGGLIVAATHGPLGIDPVRALALGPPA